MCNGNRKCSDTFYLFDSCYKQNFDRYAVKLGQLSFKYIYYTMIKVTALNR